MCYSVTGLKPTTSSAGRADPQTRIFDTEQEAKDEAEKWLRAGMTEVAVWEQVAIPRLRSIISWSDGRESVE